jgi:hypothetical protein
MPLFNDYISLNNFFIFIYLIVYNNITIDIVKQQWKLNIKSKKIKTKLQQ